MKRIGYLVGLFMLSMGSTTGLGQGMLVVIDPAHHVRLPRPSIRPDRPPVEGYKISELSVDVRLVDQVAQVQVSQSFVNTGRRQIEAAFVFPLPYDGAIDRMTLMVDGKEYPAQLLDAEAARKFYEETVRKNRDPALLEWMGMGLFKTSVFPIPPGAKRTVSLRYAQICRKDHGLTELLVPLSTAKYTSHPPEDVRINVTIESTAPIKNIYSPSHSIEVKRTNDRHATIHMVTKNEIPTQDFRLFYDAEAGPVGMSLLSYRPDRNDDGYFLLLAAPEVTAKDERPPAKTVVFVLDRSGSMSGEKIEQAKGGLKFVLNNLREGDLFNIIAYDSAVESFRPELQRFDDQSRASGIGFVEGIHAGGSTNIDEALRVALEQLKDNDQPTYIIFLTDGLPTAGETSEAKIVANARASNKVRARMFNFGVGYDVNSRLLDKLSRSNFGKSEYVRPDENIEAHVSRLYNRIDSPVLTGVTIDYAFDSIKTEDGRPIDRTYPKENYDLFEGEQLVVVGRYRKTGLVKVTIAGKSGSDTLRFDATSELVSFSRDESYGFIEKLWAVRRIGEIIDQLDLVGHNDELVAELVALSTKHGVLTPYTSFLADDQTDIRDLAANSVTCGVNLTRLAEVSGKGGFAQRAAKSSLQNAAAAPAMGSLGYLGFDDEVKKVSAIQNVGQKTFYDRAGCWIDSTVTEEQEKSAIRLVQFSDRYFELASSHGRQMSQYLVFDESVLVNLAGQCYRIDPVKTR